MILLETQPTNGWDALCVVAALAFFAFVWWIALR